MSQAPTQRQLQSLRLSGRPQVISDQQSQPPPAIEIDPRFASAFPEQARKIDQWNESIRSWWVEFLIKQTKE